MRLLFALVLALASVTSWSSSPAARSDVDHAPVPAGAECHCAMQAQPTTLAIRVVDRGHEVADRLDALDEPAFPVQPIHAALEGLATLEEISPRDAIVPRRGYDATAPPAPPLA